MNTPIVDFLKEYSESGFARFHMPGHKGKLGMSHDITEICGADDLYHADGIIAESEANATKLFETRRTFYSTEGSSLCIRTMLFLALKASDCANSYNTIPKCERPFIVAGRNAHKTLLLTAALLNFNIEWLFSESEENSLCDCLITANGLKNKLEELDSKGRKPFAVFITSPNYLGKISDIHQLSEVAHQFNIPLLVDNAHGAYLKFLEGKNHPMELGADLCCDSAHKTLPALTGTAYLHVGKESLFSFEKDVKYAMSLFGSTSPSYLLLESLDSCNKVLSENFGKILNDCIKKIEETKNFLKANGFVIEETEPLKIVINATKSGVDSKEIAEALRKYKIEPEYADNDYVVLMASPYNVSEDFEKLKEWAIENSSESDCSQTHMHITRKNASKHSETTVSSSPKQLLTPHQAIFSETEEIPVSEALGRICALPTVSCPPAVPIVAIGEEITEESVELLKYYGHEKIIVVK